MLRAIVAAATLFVASSATSTLFFVSGATATLFASSEPSAVAAEEAAKLPPPLRVATSPARMAPGGCSVLAEIHGDLNADKINDVVLVLEKRFGKPADDYPPRCLVLALKGKDNLYHRSAFSWSQLTPSNGGGASFGDPHLDISISNGTLIVHELIGDNDRTSTTRKFRFQPDGSFREIGLTVLNYKSSTAEGVERDENLNTGFVVVNPKPIVEEGADEPPLEKFYQLRCERSPIRDEDCSPYELQKWPTIPVSLVTKDSVKKGAAKWKGRADLSATLEGTYTEKYFFLRATVKDNQVTKGDRIILRGAEGTIVEPVATKRIRTADGYIEHRTYKGWEIQDSADVVDVHDGAFRYHVSIDVVDSDYGVGEHCIMSTADARGKHTGELVLGKETLLPRL